ncbi:hypothetical protein G9444_0069 [Rhodococcus erythropolis]|uniref:Uncharacterized protein n=1 Tax=Rhodococcus erythropolis TaxID=1833 RepID=A0A6G9CJW9_RHOER|nr:hypothetical protein G9444_0069 [Rhodococcus erythropolis]
MCGQTVARRRSFQEGAGATIGDEAEYAEQGRAGYEATDIRTECIAQSW